MILKVYWSIRSQLIKYYQHEQQVEEKLKSRMLLQIHEASKSFKHDISYWTRIIGFLKELVSADTLKYRWYYFVLTTVIVIQH